MFGMHPYLSQALAAARVRELQHEGAAGRQATTTRRSRRARRAARAQAACDDQESGRAGRVLIRVLRRVPQALRPAARGVRRLAGAAAAAARSGSAAQRRLMVLRMSVDRFLPDPENGADTYQEFLLRTSGPLLREPSACARRAGQVVS